MIGDRPRVVIVGAGFGGLMAARVLARAPGLKSLDDATLIRRRALLAFEEAEAACDPAQRHRLLSFVLVGAGPTGVEMAGA